MNNEFKILGRKMMALILTMALVVCLVPGNVKAADFGTFSFDLVDYIDQYYEGFNENIAVASGTCIELENESGVAYITVSEDITKDSTDGYQTQITINNNQPADVKVAYENENVVLDLSVDGEEVYSTVLYTPAYVSLDKMPTISLGETVTIADGNPVYCERYYKVDKSNLTVGEIYKAMTFTPDTDETDSDTVLTLFDETRTKIKRNDESSGDGGEDSMLKVEIPETGERILSVRGYSYVPLYYASLVFATDATAVTDIKSNNAADVNIFYEGFNDDTYVATGTQITASLDNGVNTTWQSEGQYYDDEDEDIDGVQIEFGGVKGTLYKGDDNSVYIDYGLLTDTKLSTKKLYTPIIKPFAEIPEIVEGETDIITKPWDGAYSYYRITAEDKDEVWKLKFACANDPYNYSELYVDEYKADGTYIDYYEQPYDDETGDLSDLEIKVSVKAGETIVLGLSDYQDYGQEYKLTATLQEEEIPTDAPTQEGPTTNGSTDTPTTEEVTTQAPTDIPTTVAPETTVTPTTKEPITYIPETTVAPTTKAPQTTAAKVKLGKTKVKKATKKLSAKKISLKLKKIKGAKKYQIQISKKKKFTKKNILVKKTVKKIKLTVKSKKIRNKKKLWVRARAMKVVNGKKYYGKWSKVKKAKVRK